MNLYEILSDDDQFATLLRKYGTPDKNYEVPEALEIGCWPGRFIHYCHKLGYKISGIDIHPSVSYLNKHFQSIGFNIGHYYHADFNNFSLDKEFDLVFSLGFIEHHKNFLDFIIKHIELTKINGKIIIGAPNFSTPIQRAMHRVYDEVNLNDHYLPAMNNKIWALLFESLGCEVIDHGYWGGFRFWADLNNLSNSNASLISKFEQASLTLGSYPGLNINKSDSSYLFLVARKKVNSTVNPHFKEILIELAKEISDEREHA